MDIASDDGRRRVAIEGVAPTVDGGRFPIKRTIGERVVVEADIFADGHDQLTAVLQYRHAGDAVWWEVELEALPNDRWRGRFDVDREGCWRYRVCAWVDHFRTWRRELLRRREAEDIAVALEVGARLVEGALARTTAADLRQRLRAAAEGLRHGSLDQRRRRGLDDELLLLMGRLPDRTLESCSAPELEVVVDRERARFCAWYEFFPRSCVASPDRHGTFADCEQRLAYAAAMGFDVVYLPPIHPIGLTQRKGPNNTLAAGPHDPGSPWAIGAAEGGHRAVHPQLGTPEDFRRFVATARGLGLEVAIDLAFQCSPDHPYVREHPEWFLHRPDGTVQYAENPPKKYQDIYPFHFEGEAWPTLWAELLEVVLHWVGQGVAIFRVDNPHTKPFALWEWLLREVKAAHPQVLFLAEAFARPRIMQRLAKLGFTQSYTYFTWRNTKRELTEYMGDLERVRDYFRPNFWPNTPDILHEYLQFGGRPAFVVRLVLAATLSASYGIYGPAFELFENRPRGAGSEEYLDSEKFQVRVWDLARPDSLAGLCTRVNRIRRDNPALHHDRNLVFFAIDNDQLIAYGKHTDDRSNIVVAVVNLDPYHLQSGWLELPLEHLGLDPQMPYQVHDLLSGARFLWHGPRNYVRLDPQALPAHLFLLRRRVRTERDFEYFH